MWKFITPLSFLSLSSRLLSPPTPSDGKGGLSSTTPCHHRFPLLPSMWYPVMRTGPAEQRDVHYLQIQDKPLVMYKNKVDGGRTSVFPYIIHSDICPHQGASLSQGWLNDEGNLQCPYHGFEFCKGTFCRIPNPKRSPPYFVSKTTLPLYPVMVKGDMVFVGTDHMRIPDVGPFFPPEEENTTFRSVSGVRLLSQRCQRVVENLLDMLHISYVHSFGSRTSPLPWRLDYEELSSHAGRTTFYYHPNPNTISRLWGDVETVIVENEFHLPTSTITRVFAGSIIKTVFTQSLPVTNETTLLFWKIYRNFWIDPYFPWFTLIGDWLITFLMNRTIDEDIWILKHVYPDAPSSLQTRYDVTIREYRRMYETYLSSSIHGERQ